MKNVLQLHTCATLISQIVRHMAGVAVSESKGCGYVMVECAYHCGAQLQRRLIQEHEREVCPKRPIEMQVAASKKNIEVVITENQVLK